MKNKNSQTNTNFIIYGKIGSGKDTIADYLKSYFGYYKFRIADTIKRIITEKRNLTFEQLEILKRTEPEIRDEHLKTGEFMGFEANINRCKLIASKNSLDWINLEKDNDYVICDGRSKEEIEIFLEDGAFGIFLTRETEEYSNPNHWTNQNLITNGILYELIEKYPHQILVVLNGGTYNLKKLENYGDKIFLMIFEKKYNENPKLLTSEILLENIDKFVSSIIEIQKF